MSKYLARLFPARLRKPAALKDEERLKLFSTVGEHDPCLKVIMDGLMKELEEEFMLAITSDTDLAKLEALQRARCIYNTLHNIESERLEALKWKERQGNGG